MKMAILWGFVPWWVVAATWAVTVIALAQLAHEWGWFRSVPQWRRAVAFGVVVLFSPLLATLAAIDYAPFCEWDTLVDSLGYAGALIWWYAAGCG